MNIQNIEQVPSLGSDADHPEIRWFRVTTPTGLCVVAHYPNSDRPWTDTTTGECWPTLDECVANAYRTDGKDAVRFC